MSYQLINRSAHDTGLADKSIHCIVTSPPYFGLRSYAGEQDIEWPMVEYAPMAGLPMITIAGCDPTCKHEWSEQIAPSKRGGDGVTGSTLGGGKSTQVDAHFVRAAHGTCIHCGGMKCGLGAEPTPEAFIGHLILVMREMWRVLRDDGVCFVNLGDSYFGSSQTGGTSSKEGSAKRKDRMFKRSSSGASSQYATSYGTSGKELANSLGNDCLCGSLCGECRKAYRIGKSHNDFAHDPKLAALLYAPIHEHKASEPGHFPTLDSVHQASRTSSATLDSGRSLSHEGAPLLSSQVSMPGLSSPQPLDAQMQTDSPASCLLCGRSLVDCVQGFSDKKISPYAQQTSEHELQDRTLHISCNVTTDDSFHHHIMGKACDFCSYLDYTTKNSHKQSGLKPKDLIQIPARFALAAQADGWYLRSDIIWHKPNPMPESVTDRPTKAHEYVYLLTKQEKYFYDAEAIREQSTGQNGAAASFKRETKDHLIPNQSAIQHRMDRDDRDDNGTRNRRSVWTIATSPFSGAHFATWPQALVEPMIKAGSSSKGVCGAKIKKLKVRENLSVVEQEKVTSFLRSKGWA